MGEEEDYGIEEGVSLIFILLVGALLNCYQDRGTEASATHTWTHNNSRPHLHVRTEG